MAIDPTTLTTCPRCGRPNPIYRTNCWGCGVVLPPVPATGSTLQVPGKPPLVRGGRVPTIGVRSEAAERGQVSASSGDAIGPTGTGLQLMVIGFALAWVPLVSFAGGLLLFIGFVYVWNGRHDYPPPHPRNVVLALIVVLAGVGVAFASDLTLGLWLRSRAIGPGLALGMVPGEAVAALAAVLLVYALATPRTRALLWAGYAASVGTTLVVTLLQASLFVAVSGAGGFTFGPVGMLTTYVLLSSLLPVVPCVIYSIGYHRVHRNLGSPAGSSRPLSASGG